MTKKERKRLVFKSRVNYTLLTINFICFLILGSEYTGSYAELIIIKSITLLVILFNFQLLDKYMSDLL